MILATSFRDPNDHILHIAIAITRDSWTWFLNLLINDLGVQISGKKSHSCLINKIHVFLTKSIFFFKENSMIES